MNTQKIDISLKPSKQFILLLSGLIFCSAIIIFSLPFVVTVKILLLVIMLGYGGFILWRDGLLRSKQAITRMSLSAENWILHNHFTTFSAVLCGDSTVTTFVCVLRFKVENQKKKITCLVWKDVLTEEEYRRLLRHLD